MNYWERIESIVLHEHLLRSQKTTSFEMISFNSDFIHQRGQIFINDSTRIHLEIYRNEILNILNKDVFTKGFTI